MALNYLAIAIDDALVLLHLLLVALILGMFLSLHVVTDQSACSQACARADCRACAWTPERRADQSARRCATDEMVWCVVEASVEQGLVRHGSTVAVLAGAPDSPTNATDVLRIVTVR